MQMGREKKTENMLPNRSQLAEEMECGERRGKLVLMSCEKHVKYATLKFLNTHLNVNVITYKVRQQAEIV